MNKPIYQMECECGFKTGLYDQRGNAETAWIAHHKHVISNKLFPLGDHAGGTLHLKRKVDFSWKEFMNKIEWEEGFIK